MVVPGTNPRRSRKLPVVFEPREMALRTWVQMMRTYTRVQRRLEQMLDRHGLTLPQFDVLATLRAGEGITQQELASRLLVTKGNVCGVLDRMESAGWVERRPDEHDRRANRLYLTAAGRQVLADTFPEHQALLRRVFSGLPQQDFPLFYRMLEAIEETTGE